MYDRDHHNILNIISIINKNGSPEKSYPADYDKPSFSRTCLETTETPALLVLVGAMGVCVYVGVVGEWASGHTACTYKDHAKIPQKD